MAAGDFSLDMSAGGSFGWDGPVKVVPWFSDFKALAASFQAAAPVGKAGKKRSLTLRGALGLASKYSQYRRFKAGGQDAVELTVQVSYAKIQDQGGDVPERFPRGYLAVANDAETVEGHRAGHALRWESPGDGGYVFAKRAGPFHLEGQHYIQKGFDLWITGRVFRSAEGLETPWEGTPGAAGAAA